MYVYILDYCYILLFQQDNCLEMGEKHVIKLSEIMRLFRDEEKLVSKGENAVESGHVRKMLFDSELRMIKGTIQASMRDRDYQVEVSYIAN